MKADIPQAVEHHLGFDRLRGGQEEAIEAVLAGRDTLAVMPTGSGKSAIYQVACSLVEGSTVVVSPLIALQRDQVEAVAALDVGEATQLNSTVGAGDRRQAFEEAQAGDLDFLFLAPEQLRNEDTLRTLAEAPPSLFVVDEAHCISAWGHDFRPDYLHLPPVIQALGRPTVLALTATASPHVRQDIVRGLDLRDPVVIVTGFDRPNIYLEVRGFREESDKRQALVEQVQEADGPGIVYVATRRAAEELAEALVERGVGAAAYHAGLSGRRRDEVQESFMEGDLEVVVATVAFGMGIDKADVRFVYHHDVTDSLDSYHQEIGRAGRDGEPAEAILFYRPEDLGIRRYFSSVGRLRAEDIEGLLQAALVEDAPPKRLTREQLRERSGLSDAKLLLALKRLEEVGVLQSSGEDQVELVDSQPNLPAVIEEAMGLDEAREQMDRSRVDMIRSYAESRGCRRQFLLNYFGEQLSEPCGACDNCHRGQDLETGQSLPFPVDTRVLHNEWGEGLVVRYEEDKVFVLFDQVGYKTLSVDLVRQGDLLHAQS